MRRIIAGSIVVALLVFGGTAVSTAAPKQAKPALSCVKHQHQIENHPEKFVDCTRGSSGGISRGDFNRDGIADLAVGVTGESLAAGDNAGVVHVLFGSPTGLTADGDQLLSMELPSVAALTGGAQPGAAFGASLAAGDFDADGFSDLAVGAPGTNVQSQANAGMVIVFYGSATGLAVRGASNSVFTSQTGTNGAFGRSMVWADFGRGPQGDLAIGAPGADLGFGQPPESQDAGEVHVLYGIATGLSVGGRQLFRQGLNGLAGFPEELDSFGTTLAAANFGNGATADLAIGVPLEGPGADFVDGTGAVHVVYGTTIGLSTAGNQLLSGVDSEEFGAALAAANVGRTAEADLAVGAPRAAGALNDVLRGGSVKVFYGSASGLATTPGQVLSENDAATDGVEDGDRFGSALATNDFDGNRTADLAVGVPEESLESGSTRIDFAGAVVVFYGGASGLNDGAAPPRSSSTSGSPVRRAPSPSPASATSSARR